MDEEVKIVVTKSRIAMMEDMYNFIRNQIGERISQNTSAARQVVDSLSWEILGLDLGASYFGFKFVLGEDGKYVAKEI